jgi:Flp pilus assembly protein TadG
MIKRLDDRGAVAWEFMLVAVPLFMLIFAIFDLGRYAITAQSLQTLADAGARTVMINCFNPQAISGSPSYSTCASSSYLAGPVFDLTTAAQQTAAPFLFHVGASVSPTLSVALGTNIVTVTATESGFTMLMPIWGTAFNTPSASTSIPF